MSGSVGSVPEWLVPATDAGAAKALDDLVSFIANSDVQQALVAAGLPEDQQAKVAKALRIVRALPTSHSVRDVPGAQARCVELGEGGGEAKDLDMVGDEEALQLAEEFLGPPPQHESAEERRQKILVTKGKLQNCISKVRNARVGSSPLGYGVLVPIGTIWGRVPAEPLPPVREKVGFAISATSLALTPRVMGLCMLAPLSSSWLRSFLLTRCSAPRAGVGRA